MLSSKRCCSWLRRTPKYLKSSLKYSDLRSLAVLIRLLTYINSDAKPGGSLEMTENRFLCSIDKELSGVGRCGRSSAGGEIEPDVNVVVPDA